MMRAVSGGSFVGEGGSEPRRNAMTRHLVWFVVLLGVFVAAVALGHSGLDIGINGTHWTAGNMMDDAP